MLSYSEDVLEAGVASPSLVAKSNIEADQPTKDKETFPRRLAGGSHFPVRIEDRYAKNHSSLWAVDTIVIPFSNVVDRHSSHTGESCLCRVPKLLCIRCFVLSSR